MRHPLDRRAAMAAMANVISPVPFDLAACGIMTAQSAQHGWEWRCQSPASFRSRVRTSRWPWQCRWSNFAILVSRCAHRVAIIWSRPAKPTFRSGRLRPIARPIVP